MNDTSVCSHVWVTVCGEAEHTACCLWHVSASLQTSGIGWIFLGMAFIHCSLPVWGTGSALYKTGYNQHLTQDLFFQVMELRAIGCSRACTGMCVLTLLCFPGQPRSCSSSLESTLAAGLEAGTCPALPCRLCSHLEAIPGGCSSREHPSRGVLEPHCLHSPWQPLPQPLGLQPSLAVCWAAQGQQLCQWAAVPCVLPVSPRLAGDWNLSELPLCWSVPFTWLFFHTLLFPRFFSFPACDRHHSASYWWTSF